MFALFQNKRQSIVEWFDVQSFDSVTRTLDQVLEIALGSSSSTREGQWLAQGMGRFVLTGQDLQVDVQTGELLWRNDSLKPIPDSMVQFQDFNTLFGKESLHCGRSEEFLYHLYSLYRFT